MREKTSQAEGLATRSSMAEKVQCRFCDKRFSSNNLKGHEKRHMESRNQTGRVKFSAGFVTRAFLGTI